MKIIAILQARMSSSRLPGKVLMPLCGEPMLARQIERVQRAACIDELIVATSTAPEDDAVAELCDRLAVSCYRGSLDDVLDRFVQAARPHSPNHVVRLTGDCPLADPEVIDHVITRHLDCHADYTSNCNPPSFPDGLDVEVVRYVALETAWREAVRGPEREHVTLYINTRPDYFHLENVRGVADYSELRWTVDEPEDFALVEQIYEALYPTNPDFTTRDVMALLAHRPDLKNYNTAHQRNEGLATSLAQEAEQREKERHHV